MRVMQVVHGFPPLATGGTEIYAHDLAMELNHMFGDEVLVLSREADPARAELSVRMERRNGIRVAYINNTYKLCRSFEQTYRQDGVSQVAAELMDEIQPEVIHIHHLTGLSTDLVSEAARRQVPTLFTLHDYWLMCQRGQLLDLDYQRCAGPSPTRCARCVGTAAGAGPATFRGASLLRAMEARLPSVGQLMRGGASQLSRLWNDPGVAHSQMERRLRHVRELCRRVTRFLAPSHTMLNRFLEFGIQQDRIMHAALGIDHSRFLGLGQRPGRAAPLRIGFVGSLLPSKGVHLLLEAFSALPTGSATLHIYGEPAAYHGDETYAQRIAPLLHGPGVSHEGAVPHEQVPRALSSLDVLVVPSTWMENAPLVVQEAFLAGVPVVAAQLGGLCEAVEHERNGLHFRPGDARDLHRCLQRLVDQPRLLGRLQRGIPRVRTLAEDARFLRELYTSCLRAAPERAATTTTTGYYRARMAAVVLNYGTPKDTVESVQALQRSRRPVDDVIVVDNGSTDGSEQHLRQALPGATVMQTGENLGFSGGNNVGIRYALLRGAQQLLLVNSDVTLDPDCAWHLEQALQREPELGIAGPSVLARSAPDMVASLGISYSDTTCRMYHLGFGQRYDRRSVPAVQEVDGVSGCAMLIKREVLERVGLLSEEYFFSFEDLDLCLRARREGFRSICVGRAVAFHEGGRSIGKRSPRRIYFATRNHLLMARRVHDPALPPVTVMRNGIIMGLNLAHVLLTADAPRREGLEAMVQGVWHHMWHRYGDGP